VLYLLFYTDDGNSDGLGIDGRVILKCIANKESLRVWTELTVAQDSNH